MTNGIIRRAALTLMLAGLVACGGGVPDAAADKELTTVYLVRHAEKVLDVPNPPLTDEGLARAAGLADMFAGEEIDHIHSTDYLRTRQTAAPLADRLGLEIETYDPGDLEGFAAELKAAGGTHFVVGHSNTTPQLVEALGGKPGEPIDEANEYDRLYDLRIKNRGLVVRTSRVSFGEPYQIYRPD